jgi:outer membrane protein OmpA-like peptidoglycan-associated protein
LLGNKFLAISFGSPEGTGVKDWDMIPSAVPLDVADLFKKTNDIMDTTHATMKHLESTSQRIAAITARMDHGEGTVGALLKDRTLYNNLAAATTDIAATSDEARKTVAQARVGATAFTENMQALKQNILFRGYFKDRGYQDASELAKWEIAALPEAAPLKAFTFPAGDLFEKPETVRLKGKKQLKAVAAFLESTGFSLVVVQAFSSHLGDREENRILTQAQAMVVRNYLADQFEFDDNKLKTMGMGEVAGAPAGSPHWVAISVYAPSGEK